MLREFKSVKQEDASGARRWFESDGFELVVWFDSGAAATGFQICYDFGRGEHALTWRKEIGCSHDAIDSGDTGRASKLTPILIPDGSVPWAELAQTFEARGADVDPPVRALVQRVLASRGRLG